MSMELFLFVAIESSLKTEDINLIAKKYEPIAVYEENIDLLSHTGFVSVRFGKLQTGVETYKLNYDDVAKYIPTNEDIDPNNTIVIQFRWGGDFKEGATALYTASILSAKYNGIAFDPMSGMYVNSTQLMEGYQAFLQYAQ